jgi:hypothetical protein
MNSHTPLPLWASPSSPASQSSGSASAPTGTAYGAPASVTVTNAMAALAQRRFAPYSVRGAFPSELRLPILGGVARRDSDSISGFSSSRTASHFGPEDWDHSNFQLSVLTAHGRGRLGRVEVSLRVSPYMGAVTWKSISVKRSRAARDFSKVVAYYREKGWPSAKSRVAHANHNILEAQFLISVNYPSTGHEVEALSRGPLAEFFPGEKLEELARLAGFEARTTIAKPEQEDVDV